MQSLDVSGSNIEKIQQLFPNCVTERLGKDGKPELAIDFEKLQAELSNEIIGEGEERYQFTWPDKRAANRLANTPTTMTLRPCREESVDFDHTQNLYIEGDNLDVLKALRETYLGKVKMIYIDPPYNTGNDFVYNDDFAQSRDEFEETSGLFDAEGNQTIDPMQRNTESNGRFHTDWLNMIYPRLKVARDLLSDDGVIFISIDDNEDYNLRKICDEIFGENNCITALIWNKQHSQQQGIFKKYHESILVYAKSIINVKNISGGSGIIEAGAQKKISKSNPESPFTFPAGVRFDAPDNTVIVGTYGDAEKSTVTKGRLCALNGFTTEPVTIIAGWTQKNQMISYFKGETVYDTKGQLVTEFFFNSAGKLKCTKNRSKITPPTILPLYGMVSEQTEALDKLMDGHYFDMPKPIMMLVNFISWFAKERDLILDFFSGSATTAHAVMQLNAKDGGNRKFIMVQLPEKTDEKSEAYKAGYKNICEIGKERIRRAGQKIIEENKDEEGIEKLDTGFRVLKLDSSNMEQVYYTPQEFTMQSLFSENVKADRTGEDLLFQVMLDLGIELSAKIETRQIAGKTVYLVDDNYLVACFDRDVTEAAIKEIAELHPVYFVMRDASAANDNVIDNFEQIFRHYSPDTNCRII